MKEIDKTTWKRSEHFDFFSKLDEPFFGVVCEVKCTKAFLQSKKENLSFFAVYLHKTLIALNAIHEWRTRIVDGKPVEYEAIHASATLGREDNTFGFSFVPFNRDFSTFVKDLNNETERVKATPGLAFISDAVREDVIHFSTLPWHKFTGLSHARDFKRPDSVPKITIGKAFKRDEDWFLSVAVNAHHGLVDGYHVSEFLKVLEQELNE